MSSYDFDENDGVSRGAGPEPEVILAELAPEPEMQPRPVARRFRRRVWLPLGLFLATCLSTLLAGGLLDAVYVGYLQWRAVGPLRGLVDGAIAVLGYCCYYALAHGWQYALPVMTILICHEAGHFLQARRYRVHASYPYFIPMPISPLGTLGAVIAMGSRIRHRRALFDIGITGPLAGLVPTLLCCVVGLHLATTAPVGSSAERYGDPLLLRFLARLEFGPIPEGHDIVLNPLLFAGWVGLLITSLNLIPIGQLDGGHVLYALLRKKAHAVASLLLLGALTAVIWQWKQLFPWTLMLFLLMLMGPMHPPTADDDVPLGPGRVLLGWLTLAFIPIGFTPTPFLSGL